MSTKSCLRSFAVAFCCAALGFVAFSAGASASDRSAFAAGHRGASHGALAQDSAVIQDDWIVRYGREPDSLDHPWTEKKFTGPDAEDLAKDFCLELERRGYTKFDYTIDRAPIAAISG